MVIRSWEGTTLPGKADDYLRHLSESVIPELRGLPGFLGVQVLRGVGPTDRFVVQTSWSDLESVTRFSGPNPERAVVPPEAEVLLAEFDDEVRHFDVVLDTQP